jgi:hypothetical protein
VARKKFTGEILPIKPRELQQIEQGSEAIARLDYDVNAERVTCEFVKRGTYEYYNVSPQEFAAWNTAGSRGTYFNLYIRGRYDYERI